MIDPDRLSQMVVARAPGLVLFARQWLDAPSAEDVVQEALTSLLLLRQSPAEPIAWMYRAVRNAAINQARSSSRRRQRERAVAESRGAWFESFPDVLIDGQTAQEVLQQLPAEHRQIVVLRIWGELGLAEIAAVMEMSVSTVHERYVSALEQLRGAMENREAFQKSTVPEKSCAKKSI